VAKLVHVLDHEDTDVAYQMLNIARKHITPGGPKRASMTLPPIIFEALLLLRRVQAMEFPPPVASQKETKPEPAGEESKDIAQPKDTKETEDAITNEDEEETSSAVEEKAEDSNNDGDATENGEPEESSSPDDGAKSEGETVVDAEADVTDKASAPEESIAKEPKTEESSSEEAAPLFPSFNKSVK
jgi:vacuolar protein sorting-associated protein 35